MATMTGLGFAEWQTLADEIDPVSLRPYLHSPLWGDCELVDLDELEAGQ